MVAFSHGRSIFLNFSEKGSKTENADNFTISETFTFYKIVLCLPFVSICNYNKIILATSIVYHSLMSHFGWSLCQHQFFNYSKTHKKKESASLLLHLFITLSKEIVLLFTGVVSIRHTFQWIMYKNHFIIKILLLLLSCWKSTVVISHVS